CCHHIVIDGFGIALVSRRVATIYSAIVSDAPIPPAFFGSLRDLVDCELEYEASNDHRLFVNESALVAGGYPRPGVVSFRWRGASVGDDSGSYTRPPTPPR